MPHGFKAGGRQKGVPNKATVHRRETAAQAFAGLAEEEIRALTPLDIMRLVSQHYVRTGEPDKAADHASRWAPYAHARLAPLIVEPPAEPEEAKAKRLHDAMKAMQATVGANDSSNASGNEAHDKPDGSS